MNKTTLFRQTCPHCNVELIASLQEGVWVCTKCAGTYLSDGSDVKIETEEMLNHPGLLYLIERAITAPGSSDPLIGENDNAVTLLLVLVSKGSAEIRGQTAAGKNTLVDHVLSVFPQNLWVKVGGLTDKSLRYLPNDLKILYVAERRGMESGQRGVESTAEYDAKLSISEGKITVAVTERDPETHRFITVFREVVIDSLVFTSTEVAAPPELENRLTVLYVKDDWQQNAAVRDAQLESATIPSWEKSSLSNERALVRQALKKILEEAPTEVIVPYAPALATILSERSSVVRRNTPKLLALLKASARIYYRQRQIIQGTNGEKALVAEPLDLAIVLYTAARVLRAALSTTPEKVSLTLEVCKELSSRKTPITVESIMLNAGDKPIGAKQTVRAAVRYLAEKGVLTESQEKAGKLKMYELQSTEAPLVLDVPKILHDASEEYERWLGGVGISLQQASSVKESERDFTLVNGLSGNFPLDAQSESNPSPDEHSHSGQSQTSVNLPLDGETSVNSDSDSFTLDARLGDIHLSQESAPKGADPPTTQGVGSDSDKPSDSPHQPELCPPWLTTEQWEKLSPDQKRAAWEKVPRSPGVVE